MLAATGLLSSAFAIGCDEPIGNPKPPNCDDPNLGSSAIDCADLKIVDLQDDAPFGNLATDLAKD